MESQAAWAVSVPERRKSENPARTLGELRPGQSAYVTSIKTNGLLRRRLMDLGFVPGTRVENVLESPAGDPVVYRVRGTNIALRRSDASRIAVSETEPVVEGAPRFPAACSSSPTCFSCNGSATAGSSRRQGREHHFLVALAGNPNTGKSTVFNALTGLRQHVGNWPGKTVTRAEGTWEHCGFHYKLIDLPGTYSLLSTSTDEEIARDFLLFGSPDCTVVVVDATCFERNLNLVFQILEITNRVVVCVNLMDEARRKGIEVNLEELERELGVPVVGTTARTGEGLDRLQEMIHAVASGERIPAPHRIPFDDELQQAVEELLPYVEKAFPGLPNSRWIAMRLIDGGDTRLREEIEAGVLADLSGRIGEASLGGTLSPAT